jgi:hypothetical protein
VPTGAAKGSGVQRRREVTNRIVRWRAAWVALAFALVLHVTDEALTGFLAAIALVVTASRARVESGFLGA